MNDAQELAMQNTIDRLKSKVDKLETDLESSRSPICSTSLDDKIEALWNHAYSQFIPENACSKANAYDERTFKKHARRILLGR